MGQLISNLENGSLVKLNENGGPIKFLKLDNDHYGIGTGVTMLRKDAYAQTAWNAAYTNYNVYIGCPLDNICDVIFPSRLDPEIQRCIVPVPIIVAEGNQVSTLHTIRRRGFALSCTEAGVSGWQTEGKAFAYFDTNEKRIAYLDGTATAVLWGLRSPSSVASSAFGILAGGSVYNDVVHRPLFAARPAFNLKSTILVSDSTDGDGCYTVESVPEEAGGVYVKQGGVWVRAI